MGAMGFFKTIIFIQLFYAFAITILAYSMPANALTHVDIFSPLAQEYDATSISNNLEENIDSQLNIPVVELGALIFYSGNILLDLLLNFVFALPEMISIFINGFLLIFNIDNGFMVQIQIFLSSLILIMYFLSLLTLLSNIRSSQGIA